jgi:hypothetical protein
MPHTGGTPNESGQASRRRWFQTHIPIIQHVYNRKVPPIVEQLTFAITLNILPIMTALSIVMLPHSEDELMGAATRLLLGYVRLHRNGRD